MNVAAQQPQPPARTTGRGRRPGPHHRSRQQDPGGEGGRRLPVLGPRGEPRPRRYLRPRAVRGRHAVPLALPHDRERSGPRPPVLLGRARLHGARRPHEPRPLRGGSGERSPADPQHPSRPGDRRPPVRAGAGEELQPLPGRGGPRVRLRLGLRGHLRGPRHAHPGASRHRGAGPRAGPGGARHGGSRRGPARDPDLLRHEAGRPPGGGLDRARHLPPQPRPLPDEAREPHGGPRGRGPGARSDRVRRRRASPPPLLRGVGARLHQGGDGQRAVQRAPRPEPPRPAGARGADRRRGGHRGRHPLVRDGVRARRADHLAPAPLHQPAAGPRDPALPGGSSGDEGGRLAR
ncbi:MAG: hypothetical protein KatS3mg014_0273 [Actinomycetota bacterium]|nr:MAG: hypothetical protein KatS3mg014_0273 [Actinomycetota bacterium]